MNKAVEHALAVLGIRQPATVYDLSPGEFGRLRMYLGAHAQAVGEVLLHNDVPHAEGFAAWQPMNKLLFRGSRAAWNVLGDGFSAVPDVRFDKPVIIRDGWRDKRVMSHMQTKAVLAWSKSFYVALEYAFGCISGGLGARTPGYLHFCWIEEGIDVLEAVRKWEQHSTVMNDQIDPGRQHEVLTPSMPRSRIVATWELRKREGLGGSWFELSAMTVHAGNFAAVMPQYEAIARLFEVGMDYDYAIKGLEVDRIVLV